MWIILGVLFSFSASALAPYESIKNVKILRVLPNNVVMLNRGLEDGIMRNDHAKLSTDIEGYGSRAICVRVTSETSYWKLYRVPHSEAFSLDYTYTLAGMADKEIPVPQDKIRESQMVIDGLSDKETKEASIQGDLPSGLTEKDLLNKKKAATKKSSFW